MRIDQTNYESFLLSYVDGELTETEKREVEVFCAGNPEAARDLGLLQQTVMIPTVTVFDEKASLYREEEKRHVIGWYFWRAAIVIVLLAGGGWLYLALNPGAGMKDDSKKMASVKTPEPGKPGGSPDTVTSISPGTITAAAAKKAVREKMAVNASSDPENQSARENIRETDPVSGGKSSTAGNNKKPVKKSGESGNGDDKTTNVPAVQDQNSDPAAGTPGSGEEVEFPVVAAPTGQLQIAAVRAPVNLTGNPINIPLTENAGEIITVRSGKTRPPHQVAVNDGPAEEGMTASTGDDAVSVLHMAKHSSAVGKLFHRLTGGKSDNDRPDNGGDKKLNISVFQFAVGK